MKGLIQRYSWMSLAHNLGLGKYMNVTQDKTHYVLCLEMFSKQLDFGKIGKGNFCLTQHSFY